MFSSQKCEEPLLEEDYIVDIANGDDYPDIPDELPEGCHWGDDDGPEEPPLKKPHTVIEPKTIYHFEDDDEPMDEDIENELLKDMQF